MGRNLDGVRAASAKTIEIDFYYAGERCRERIKLVPTPANLKRASQHRASILDAIARGVFDYLTTFPNSKTAQKFVKKPESLMTLELYLESWLKQKECELKAATYKEYERTINGVLIPKLGKTPIEELTCGMIRKFAAEYQAGNKRIRNILSVLRVSLTDAVEDELIENNPIVGWSYKKTEGPKENDDVDPFTTEEQAAILSILNGQMRNQVQFAFWTGVRTSELVALEWKDIDWKRGVVRIRRAKTQISKVAEITRTTSGTRDIKLLRPALEALKAQKQFTFLKGKEIFQNPRKQEPWSGDRAIRKYSWIPALKRAGVVYRRPYQTRHTYASMMLSAGENPMWVAQQMGHKDWGMIRKIYGRFMSEVVPLAGEHAVRAFASEAQVEHMTA